MPIPRAYLVDSSIYIFRAWHVYDPSITDRQGNPSNAAIGFADFLYQLLEQEQPAYIACAFDSSQRNSFRKELYPDYKANREPAPEELKVQFRRCQDFCRAVGIAEFSSERFEADDIIGALAHRLRRQGMAVTVVSADKDLTQLILGEEDRWWDFARGRVLDYAGVTRQFGVKPEQIADLLALCGDQIDNIPGVPGIGHVTAARILRTYPSIEDLLENIQGLAALNFRGATRTQALIDAHKDLLPLNKKLTTLITDMEFEDEPDLAWKGLNADAFAALSEQLAISEAAQRRWMRLAARGDKVRESP